MHPTLICASDARLLEITEVSLNPPRVPTPVQEDVPEAVAEAAETGVDVAASTQPVGLSSSASFDFMQASELEPSFEENAEWVERSDAVGHPEEQAVEPVNGHVHSEKPLATVTPPEDTVSSVFHGGFYFYNQFALNTVPEQCGS